jgi:hypothetical protein
MTDQYEYRHERRGGSWAGVVLALIVGAVAVVVFVHHARNGLAGRLAAMISGRPETVVYSLDTVVETSESNAVLPDVLAGDRLLMIVHGETIAGVDMSKLKPEDVQIGEAPDGRTITLTLPASEVFLTAIDNAKSRVYARDTGLFVKADPNLETVTRQKAEGQLQQAALSDGVLDAASKNARSTVVAMLEGLGFAKVDVK